ncbi:MAG: peptidase S53, partial [Saccharolobus sp.]
MIKKSLVILAMLLLSSVIPIVAMGEGQANQLYYYIYTTSPKYSIIPGSQFVQPLNSSQSLYIAVLLDLTNF